MGYMDDLFMTGNLTTSPTQNQKQEYDGKPKDGDRADLDVELEDENRKAEMSPEKDEAYRTKIGFAKPKVIKYPVYRRLRGALSNPAATPDFASACIANLGSPVPPGHIYKAQIISIYSSTSITSLSLTHDSNGLFYNGMMNQLVSSSNLTASTVSIEINPEAIFREGEQIQIVITTASSPVTFYATLQIEDINLKDM